MYQQINMVTIIDIPLLKSHRKSKGNRYSGNKILNFAYCKFIYHACVAKGLVVHGHHAKISFCYGVAGRKSSTLS